MDDLDLPTPSRQMALNEKRGNVNLEPESAKKVRNTLAPALDDKHWRLQCEKLQREARDSLEAFRRLEKDKKLAEDRLRDELTKTNRRAGDEAAEMRKRVRDEETHDKKHMSEIQSKLKDEKARTDGLVADVRKAQIEAASLREAKTTADTEMAEATDALNELKILHRDLQVAHDSLQAAHKFSLSDLEVKDSELRDVTAAMHQSREDKAAAENEMLRQLEKCNQTEATFKNLAAELTEYRTSDHHSASMVQATQVELNNTKQALREQNAEVDSLSAKLRAATLALTSCKSELDKVKADLGGLQGTASTTESDRDNLQQRLRSEAEESVSLRDRLGAMANEVEAKDLALGAATRDVTALRAKLEKSLRDRETTTKVETKCAELQKSLDDAQRANLELSQQIVNGEKMTEFEGSLSKQYKSDFEGALQQVHTLELENEALQREMADRGRTLSNETQRSNSLVTALTRCQEDLTSAQSLSATNALSLKEQATSFRELQVAHATATEENAKMRSSLGKNDSDVVALRASLDAKTAEYHAAAKALETATVRTEKLEASVSSAQSQLLDANSQRSVVAAALEAERQQLQTLRRELQDHRKVSTDSKILIDGKTKENAQLYVAVDSLEKKLGESDANLHAAKAHIATMQQTMKQEREGVLASEAQLQWRVSSTAKDLEEAREASERNTRTITNLSEEIRTRTAEKIAMTDAMRTLEADLAQHKKHSTQLTSELVESRQATTRAISECQAKNKDLSKSSETLQETASRLLKADEEVRACVSEVAEARSRVAHVTMRLDNERQHSSQLTNELAVAKAAHTADQKASITAVAEREGEIAHLKASIKRANATIELDAAESARVRAQLQGTESALSETQSNLMTTQTELKAELDARASLQTHFDKNCEEMRATVSTVHSLQKELSALGGQFIGSQQRLQQIEAALGAETARTSQYAAEIARQRNEMDTAAADRNALHARYTDLVGEHTRVSASESRALVAVRTLEDSVERAAIAQRSDRIEFASQRAEMVKSAQGHQSELDRRAAEIHHLNANLAALEQDLQEQRAKVFTLGRETEEIFTVSAAKVQRADEQRDLHIRKYHSACWDNVQYEQDVQEWRVRYTSEYENFEQQKINYEGALAKQAAEYGAREQTLVAKIVKEKTRAENAEKKLKSK